MHFYLIVVFLAVIFKMKNIKSIVLFYILTTTLY